jgi:radical SAM superfamily enzyme YgiQ (UPF0313 family)
MVFILIIIITNYTKMNNISKPKLFLADLGYINRGTEWTIIPFPLNVSYMAAYVQKLFPNTFDIRIFKEPEKFLNAIKNEKPNIVGFTNYIWNRNLTLKFATYLKELHPDCTTIMGGPNYNFAELDWVEQFMRETPQIDFHIEGEGEVKFTNVVEACLKNEFIPAKVKLSKPSGACFIEPETNRCVIDTISRIGKLDDVPSPYQTGLLDEFLADPIYCPIIETNRGCPYLCTFCDWGSMGKSTSSSFSMERVVTDLEYIVENNVSKTPYLYIGDANFGLFPRDIEIAKLLRKYKDTKGFPQNVYLYFAKNSSENVLKIAELIKDMTNFSLSRQTQNPDVLKIIKRDNIPLSTFNKLAALGKELGVSTFVELIYTLPGESKQSFYNGVREILLQKVDGLHFFPSMLFDGAEMSTNTSRKKYGLKGEWRFIDGCAGSYGPINSMEFEEIITSTNAMTRDEHMELRLFHFIENWLIDSKVYKDLEVLLGNIEFIDLIFDLIANYQTAPMAFKKLVEDFLIEAKSEFTVEKPTDITKEMVQNSIGNSVKLNPLFQAKLLHEPGVRDAFNEYLKERIMHICGTDEKYVDAVIEHINHKIYPFNGSTSNTLTTIFDVLSFQNRPLHREIITEDYFLDKPKTFRYIKKNTYENFVDSMGDLPLPKKVYEICLHFSQEHYNLTLVYTNIEEVGNEITSSPYEKINETSEAGGRKIRLEDGWVT